MPVTKKYLNPVGILTLNLISGLDWYERVTVTRDSEKSYVFLRLDQNERCRSYCCCLPTMVVTALTTMVISLGIFLCTALIGRTINPS